MKLPVESVDKERFSGKNHKKEWHRNMKKGFAFLLTLMFTTGIFAGCANQAPSAEGTQPSPAASGAAETSDVIEKISNDGITWTIFKAGHTVFGTQIDDWNDVLFFKEMEKRTGVKLDFITPVLGQEGTQFQLLVSSHQLPDFISGTNGYTGGGEAMINDGLILDLSQYLDKLPNFNANLNATELRSKEVYTDSGKIAGLPAFYANDEESEIFVGILLRKDLLEKVKLDVPVTYDDWYNVLTAFKNQAGIKKGFVPGPEMFGQNNMWSIGYGFGYVDYFGTNLPFYQIDGKVRYAPVDDTQALKSYLEMMKKWYAEGLIDPDFQSVTDVNAQIGTFSNPDTGACITAYSLAPVLKSIAGATNPDFEYITVPIPVLEEGQKTHMYAATSRMDLNQILISTECKEVDLALKYWDQYYTAEGSLLACWGVENDTFTYDANGEPQWTDKIVKNPDYNFLSMRYVSVANGLPGVYERKAQLVEEQSIADDALYRSQGDNSYRISSNVSLTEEENEVYAAYMSDILTFVQEKCLRYILGAESLDTFDDMVKQVKAMNIDKVIEVYQKALDRYNAR